MSTAFSILDPPSCSVNFTYVRIDHFTRTTVTWQQPPNTPPVTSTTVTYCPTSSPNCENSMNCTTSPCTISGLDPCVNYNITLTPTNNCGNATGCTGRLVAAKGYNITRVYILYNSIVYYCYCVCWYWSVAIMTLYVVRLLLGLTVWTIQTHHG